MAVKKLRNKEINRMGKEVVLDNMESMKKELFRLKAQAAVTTPQNPGRIGALRRDIARMMTRLTQIKGGNN